MIKKIPIKGISRDPSGQLSSDGMCAESLNVQLDMGEIAPAIKPRTLCDSSGAQVNVSGDILFIHKGAGYENLIYRDGIALRFTPVICDAVAELVYDNLGPDEEILDIKSVGNTVIVATSQDMYYILWRDGAYRFLGNQIPVPAISFRIGELDSERVVPEYPVDYETADYSELVRDGVVDTEGRAPELPHRQIGDTGKYGSQAKKYTFDNTQSDGFWNDFLDSVWGDVDRVLSENAASGKAVFPIFVRYAVRLYDGTSYAQSIPVLLGAEISRFIDVRGVIVQIYRQSPGDPDEEELDMTIAVPLVVGANGYSIVLQSFSGNAFDGWDDIVGGVDIFISQQIAPIQRNAAKFKVTYRQEFPIVAVETMRGFSVDDFRLDPYYTEENQEKLILNYQNTYLAKSYSLDEFRNLSGEVTLDDINFSSDYILAQEALKETPQSMHHVRAARLFDYNKRLIASGAEQSLHHGYQFLPSSLWAAGAGTTTPVRFVYYIRSDSGESVVVCRDMNGDEQITPRTAAILSGSGTLYRESLGPWLAYPDSRCYKMEVYYLSGQTRMVSFRMHHFDQADVAFVFMGFGKAPGTGLAVSSFPTENDIVSMPDTLLVSKANNPFVFPADQSVHFPVGEILNLAVATIPLSEGQFGQFPLYVFTDEGVFALSVGADGSFQTAHPVSRDLLISKDALVGIEQGVFFAAARGLLLLQGSTVTKVSSLMDGYPSEIEDADLVEQLANRFLDFYPERQEGFQKFLSGCVLSYDYANTRILLMNPLYKTMYVYKFDTQSWHRLNPVEKYPVRTLNSYPEALVVMSSSSGQCVLDFSVLAESEGAESVPGIIYTRDLDLDNADVYKAVNRLRVRGRFQDGHVKWQLQGSNDGINYKTLHSLRGPSWKWYRVILVTLLEPQERLSYVEIDYEPKFVNKIR